MDVDFPWLSKWFDEPAAICLSRLRRSGTGYLARCPAHDDRKASLSVRESEDCAILVKCFAGCTFEEIRAVYDADEAVQAAVDDVETT